MKATIIEGILQIAQHVYGANPLSACKETQVVWARAAISVELRKLDTSYCHIGKIFNRNHATVIYAVKKHPDNMIYDKEYRELFNTFEGLVIKANISKKIYQDYIKERVMYLNSEMLGMGYDFDFIENFWKECVDHARLKNIMPHEAISN